MATTQGREEVAAERDEDVAERGAEVLPATEYALETYLPAKAERRQGVALCLSGGGYRAALFHLGALRRLNEQGILSQLDTISSVSGGSLIAAHLADRLRPWPAPGTVVPDWEERVASPFRALARQNIRTAPLLKRLLPWNWFQPSTAIDALAESLERHLTSLKLTELPDRPQFIFCATDMTFGVNWEFTKAHIGDYQAGYLRPAPAWPVARAVAASSCFPPVFDPMQLDLDPNQLRGGSVPLGATWDALVAALRLTDGGVYDNMALEPVWKSSRVVLVSNGGATFDFGSGTNWLTRLLRYNTITGNQAGAIRKRWLIAGFINGVMAGAYWGIGSAVKSYGEIAPPGYSKRLVEEVIAEIRTDLDAFSEAEIAVLENHGYLLADAAIQRHARTLLQEPIAPLSIPHPRWMDEERVREVLEESHRVRLPLGRMN
ncbi:MAG: patatin-like phospholipase family protein [Chloroflexota bacterium]|nr:patatin-like phospholipase family protein [Chloroflexota bacterium]